MSPPWQRKRPWLGAWLNLPYPIGDGYDADGVEQPALFVADGKGIHIEIEESSAHTPLTIDPLVYRASLKASNTDAGDDLGSGLGVDSDRFVVGARFEESVSAVVNGDQNDNMDFGGVPPTCSSSMAPSGGRRLT